MFRARIRKILSGDVDPDSIVDSEGKMVEKRVMLDEVSRKKVYLEVASLVATCTQMTISNINEWVAYVLVNKHSGELNTYYMENILELKKIDPSWISAFNFGDPNSGIRPLMLAYLILASISTVFVLFSVNVKSRFLYNFFFLIWKIGLPFSN